MAFYFFIFSLFHFFTFTLLCDLSDLCVIDQFLAEARGESIRLFTFLLFPFSLSKIKVCNNYCIIGVNRDSVLRKVELSSDLNWVRWVFLLNSDRIN